MSEEKTIRKCYNKECITLNSKNNQEINFGHDTWSGRKRDFPIQGPS